MEKAGISGRPADTLGKDEPQARPVSDKLGGRSIAAVISRCTRRWETVGKRRLLPLFLSVPAAALAVGAHASAATPTSGCPDGFELISVTQAEAEGYPLARVVDEFEGNPPGNRDGYACRRPLGDGVFHDDPARPDTVYLWFDNSLVRANA